MSKYSNCKNLKKYFIYYREESKTPQPVVYSHEMLEYEKCWLLNWRVEDTVELRDIAYCSLRLSFNEPLASLVAITRSLRASSNWCVLYEEVSAKNNCKEHRFGYRSKQNMNI